MFERTTDGLSNEHLFHDADLTVYCEGSGMDGEHATRDELFWHRVFAAHGKTVLCKSIGSKTAVLERAARIRADRIANVAVAMDRDYDHVTGAMLDHPQVFYTFGYSWESDVMLDFNFDSAISLFGDVKDKNAFRDDFEHYRSQQSGNLRRVFALDLKYIGHSGKLFDRNKPLSIIKAGDERAPRINVSKLLKQAKQLGRYQTAMLPPRLYSSACGVRSFFGKAVAQLFHRWFLFRTSHLPKRRQTKYDTFMS